MKKAQVIIVVGLILLSNCSSISDSTEVFNERGTVILGLCWLIVNDDGMKYEPINLDAEFRIEDLSVKFEFKRRTDLGSICMQGRMIELIKIEKL